MATWIQTTPVFASPRRRSRGLRPPLSSYEAQASLPLRVTGLVISAEEILYDATDWWRWMVKILCRHGLQANYEAIYGVWRRDFLDAVNRREMEYWPAFCQFLRAVGCSPVQISELLVAALPRRAQFEREIRSIPDVRKTLRRLRERRLRLAVVSCAPVPSDHIVERMRHVGLFDEFEQVVTAWELRHATSDSTLYRQIAARWNLRVEQVAMIGRDPIEVAAAAAAGMTTISCVRPVDPWQHYRVDHLGDVLRLMDAAILRKVA